MTRLTTHLQGDCLAKPFDLESRIRRFLSDITDTAIRHDHLYRDLRELEQAAAEHTARVASCELRSSLRPEATTILLCILPKDRFTVRDDTIPKLEKAASIWAVDKLLILFCISFDHCQQGRAFFTELLHLAEVNNHWPACIKALNRAARDRRAGYKVYNPSTRATRGIALDDIHKSKQFLVSSKIALSKPASVPKAIDYYPNGDNRGAAAEVSELSHHDASHANSSKRGQSVKEDSSSNPAESRSQTKSIEQGVTAETIVSEQENSADTLGEDESVELPRGSEQDTDAFDPAGQSVELASSDISSLFGDENPPNDSEASDPLATDSYRYFDFDSENQPDNFLDFGDNAAATHGFEEKDIAQDCNSAPGDTPHPPFPSKIMAAPPSPKRQRRSRNHPPILEQEATAILQHGHPIEQGLVNRALADICDSQGADICFVDSTQLDDMGRDDYQACPDLAHGPRGVLNCRSVIVPVKISDAHIVCGVIRQRRLAATMVGYYKSSGEPWETTPRVHDAIAKFIKVYLPATANRRRPPTPFDGPRESNIEDSGVVSFAMAIMYISHVPVIKLHMGIWRRVLAVCLGHEVTDWKSTLRGNQDAAALDEADNNDIEGQDGGNDDGLEALRAAMPEVFDIQRRQRRLQRQAERSISQITERLETLRCNGLVVLQAFETLQAKASEEAKVLEEKLAQSTHASTLNIPLPAGCPNPIQLSSQLENVSQTVKRMSTVIEALEGLETDMRALGDLVMNGMNAGVRTQAN